METETAYEAGFIFAEERLSKLTHLVDENVFEFENDIKYGGSEVLKSELKKYNIKNERLKEFMNGIKDSIESCLYKNDLIKCDICDFPKTSSEIDDGICDECC